MRKFLAFLSVIVFSFAVVHSAMAFVSPGNPQGFVSDFANVLEPADKSALEAKLQDFSAKTGNEVSVVTVKNLGGDTIENYAVELFQTWGIGKKGKDNGALLLVALEDKEVRIEVGYGLEGDLPDATANRIIQKVAIPAFKNGDYSGGIIQSADAIISTLGGDNSYSSGTAQDNIDNFPVSDYIWFALFAIMWLGAILGRSKSWWAGGVIGGIISVILGFIFGFFFVGIIAFVFLVPGGLLFDFIVSRAFEKSKSGGTRPPWWIGGGGIGGGGFGGGSGGGFGGFGGGMSGGGGASGRW